jgi:hypothetical protein
VQSTESIDLVSLEVEEDIGEALDGVRPEAT